MPDQTPEPSSPAAAEVTAAPSAPVEARGPSLAGSHPRRLGERLPGTMRRIGLRHAVMTEPITAKLVDRNALQVDLGRTTEQLARARLLVAQLDAQRSQLETKLAQFDAAPIERLDGDPSVPIEAEPVDLKLG